MQAQTKAETEHTNIQYVQYVVVIEALSQYTSKHTHIAVRQTVGKQ